MTEPRQQAPGRGLRIAVASGKGGTGKTTVSGSLALALVSEGGRVAYVDCDVEEPNGHIFFGPAIYSRQEVSVPVPEVDAQYCDLCGACARACRFSAIVALPNRVLTFPKLCHGCGGCSLACEPRAIREVPRVIGVVEKGVSGRIAFVGGKLNVGEAMAPPLIREVLKGAPASGIVVLDAPPGTSCPVIESVKTADVVLLVTEPTPFGLNDLALAVDMVRELGLPFGVAVNRVGIGDEAVFDFCRDEAIPVLLEVPDDREIARAYSCGQLAVAARPSLQPLFLQLHQKLARLARAPRPAPAARPSVAANLAVHTSPAPETLRVRTGPDAPELVVVSGKGGTGKTSITASFFALARGAAVADCDVDAADLHLVLDPVVVRRTPFSGGRTAVIDPDRCTGCGVCEDSCRFEAVRLRPGPLPAPFEVLALSCEGCGACVDNCPAGATSLVASTGGEWFVSETRNGPMAHARLGVAQENSGKLVTLVRREAKAVAASAGRSPLIVDGSPGIGCPVIASVTGASLVLIVTEPTLSGLHDLRRIAELCRQLRVQAAICVNKADINPDIGAQIEAEAATRGIPVLGHVSYDESVTRAQVRRRAVVEDGDGPAARDIRALWERVRQALSATAGTELREGADV